MAKNDNLGDFLTDIANAIRTKKESSGTINAQNFSSEILSIPTGGGGDITFAELPLACEARAIYDKNGYLELFEMAWQDMKDSETVLFDIPLALAAPNQDMGGMYLDLYIGDSDLTQLYNDCLNEVIPLPSSGNLGDTYLINNVAVRYYGDISGDVGFPIPLFEFGSMEDVNGFIIGDLTPLGMGLGLVLAKIVDVSIPNNNIVIQQGFEFENESGIIIPNSVTSIGDGAFSNWSSNNQPLVIPNSVTSIGDGAFSNWSSNNQPLVIPNSVTSIGNSAFQGWTGNSQPLVIPNSIISIGTQAFYGWTNVPYVEMKSETPPTLSDATTFDAQNNAPIYVPDASLNAYKTATNWTFYASRIFSINEK